MKDWERARTLNHEGCIFARTLPNIAAKKRLTANVRSKQLCLIMVYANLIIRPFNGAKTRAFSSGNT